MNYHLENKIALVTGGSGGIGSAISLELARSGAHVFVHYNSNPEKADLVVKEIVEDGKSAEAICANLLESNAIEEMVATIAEKHGRIDILVNNAAVNREILLVRLKDEDIDYVLGINLIGLVKVTRICARHMMKNRYGRIVHISSPAGVAGSPAQSLYSASKGALHAFSKSIAQELGSRNITSNIVLPGIINTRMIETLTDKRRNEFLDRIPLGRFGEPSEVAKSVCFLVSDEAGYISGVELWVTGAGTIW